MTSLVSWIGADQRGPASAYIATDSRISWDDTASWDSGRKAFACQRHPELFAYVGDVLFPSLVLGQLVTAIDAGLILSSEDTPQQRADKIACAIQAAFEGMPTEKVLPLKVLHITRQGDKMNSTFHASVIEWSPKRSWSRSSPEVPSKSDTVVIWGSGTDSIRKWQQRWNQSSQRDTSRAVFSAFCDSVREGDDPKSGGVPQLVGMYRIGPGRTFGVVCHDRPYVFGLSIGTDNRADSVEWRNHQFERCRPNGELLLGAKRHHVPKGLGGIL